MRSCWTDFSASPMRRMLRVVLRASTTRPTWRRPIPIYADRHDRVCEVVAAGTEYMFCEGRGGLPGNNDSGGLSSLYMWNAMGIFPVSGQDMMLIGTPRLNKAVIHMANGRDFTISRTGEGIYVKHAVLNSRELRKMAFSVTEMMQGGTLELCMTE